MKVTNLMTTHPVFVAPSDTIQQVEEIMHKEDIRQLPVVDDGEVVGIITDRDLRSFLGGPLLAMQEQREKFMMAKVETVMSTKPVTLSPDDELRDAVDLLIEEKIGGIPVVDEKEGLVGIVTYVDVLRCFQERLEEE